MSTHSEKVLKEGTYIIFTIIFLLVLGCTKQNTPQPVIVDPDPVVPDEYYEALREYKKSDHPIMFGWVGGLGGDKPSGRGNGAWELPDSLDLVSLWGGNPPIGSQNYNELIEVRKKKGTRFVMVEFDDKAFLNRWSDTNFVSVYDKGDATLQQGFELIAKKLKDTIERYQLDGLDLDHEPNVCGCDWGLFGNAEKYSLFLKVLSKYFGPLSGTDKLLIVDGEYSMITPSAATGLSYIITQSYGTGTAFGLQSRFNSTPAGFPPQKFIVTETYEQYKAGGGNLQFMSTWNPTQGRKGGAGAYHLEYDFATNSLYPYERIRKSIQLMNPAAK